MKSLKTQTWPITALSVSSQTCPRSVRNISPTCPKHVQNMSRTYPTHVLNMSKTYLSDKNTNTEIILSTFGLISENILWTLHYGWELYVYLLKEIWKTAKIILLKLVEIRKTSMYARKWIYIFYFHKILRCEKDSTHFL